MSKIILIGCIVVLVLIVLVVVLFSIAKDNAKQIKELKSDNKLLQRNIEILAKYSDVIAKIRKEKEEVNEEIIRAESTEEIIDIINRIINANNARVSNNQKSKHCSS